MTWGGSRKGAGRPRTKVADSGQPPVESSQDDPLQFLIGVMQGRIAANPAQLRAAIAAAQYVHNKKGDGGKKDEQAEAAKKAAAKFNTPKAPLKLVGA